MFVSIAPSFLGQVIIYWLLCNNFFNTVYSLKCYILILYLNLFNAIYPTTRHMCFSKTSWIHMRHPRRYRYGNRTKHNKLIGQISHFSKVCFVTVSFCRGTKLNMPVLQPQVFLCLIIVADGKRLEGSGVEQTQVGYHELHLPGKLGGVFSTRGTHRHLPRHLQHRLQRDGIQIGQLRNKLQMKKICINKIEVKSFTCLLLG